MTEMDIPRAIAEIQQSRSEFQLRHFVIGQHDTPEMQFYQCCIELQDMEARLAHATLARRRTEIQIDRLRKSGDELDEVDADIKELELRQQRLAEIGAEREVECLRRFFHEMPKFTRSQIEQAQPEYWRARLTRQAELQVFAGRRGLNWAHAEAMLQAGALREELPAVQPQGHLPPG